MYRQNSNMKRSLEGNKLVDYSDVVGASPVGDAPTASSFSTQHLASVDLAKAIAGRDETHLYFWIWGCLHYRLDGNIILNEQ